MKILKSGVVRYWMLQGMLITLLVVACGFFAFPALTQLYDTLRADHQATLEKAIPEPPKGEYFPPVE